MLAKKRFFLLLSWCSTLTLIFYLLVFYFT